MPFQLRIPCVFVLLALLAGCASAPQKADRLAAEFGFTRLIVPGEGFEHIAYFSPGTGPSDTLHVYLEGDGTPWLTPTVISPDPTPRKPLMLRLMRHDTKPALLLGRPCYFGLARQLACSAELWTSARYGPRVLDSLSRALRNFLQNPPAASEATYTRIGLFGYSGGGALAMLLAPRFPETYAVATVAGNLNVTDWTTLHRYSALAASFNPADQAPLPRNIAQVHWAGAKDDNLPPSIIQPVVARQHNAIFRIEENADHFNGWDEAWQWTLSYLNGLAR